MDTRDRPRLVDFIDAGASYDEPVKAITKGDICRWYDEYNERIEKLMVDCAAWSENYDEATTRLREEIKTVSRVWKALEISTFEQAGGNAIWEIVSRHRSALESISKNGCCDNCQEAKTVAIAALTGPSVPRPADGTEA